MSGLHLNLGCGMKRLDGYLNVDLHGEPDLRHDLEVIPWPWPDNSVGEILLMHALEHLGGDPIVYLDIMKELYRVCHDGATIQVVVPHHRHDYFFNDPTRVRPVTAEGMTLFSQRLNRRWIAQGIANSPLGIYLGIDFELIDLKLRPSALWYRFHPQQPVDRATLMEQGTLCNNLIEEVQMTLRTVKPPGTVPDCS